MAESAFAYYRSTPAVMALDQADGAQTGIQVQTSGDAQLSNFGPMQPFQRPPILRWLESRSSTRWSV